MSRRLVVGNHGHDGISPVEASAGDEAAARAASDQIFRLGLAAILHTASEKPASR